MQQPARNLQGLLLIDAMNVIGSRPDGWWRDRDAAVRRLAAALRPLARVSAVTMVCDGQPVPDLDEGVHGGVDVRYAGAGPDAADDLILHLLFQLPAGVAAASVEVVTADRKLRARVQAAGATVVGPSTLRRRITAAHAAPADHGTPD